MSLLIAWGVLNIMAAIAFLAWSEVCAEPSHVRDEVSR